jgi:hypothetical protein
VARLALVAALVAALAAPAYADQSVQFTLGRVLNTLPDKQNRIGIRSICGESGGCKVDYSLKRGAALLGGTQALLLGGTTQTDYVTLTKKTAASLRAKRALVTLTAVASDPDGNKVTLTKSVTIGPKTTKKPKPRKPPKQPTRSPQVAG